MSNIDPWLSGRLGGTGKTNESGDYKVRDSRTQMRGQPRGPRGLSRREKRRMRQEIRRLAKSDHIEISGPASSSESAKSRRTRPQSSKTNPLQRNGNARTSKDAPQFGDGHSRKNSTTHILRITIAALSAACVLVWLTMYVM